MRKVFLVFIAAFSLLGLVACGSTGEAIDAAPNPADTAIDAAHNSRNSVNWAGVYRGVIPAADGPGINVEITLGNDETYSISYQYIDRSDEVFTGSGTFKWDDAGSTIALDFEDKDAPAPFAPYYQVGENILIQLDMSGEKITGDLADNYVLKKVLE
ncbi:copper resistance protein NlpE [Breznakiellaceae bacterium SP9]